MGNITRGENNSVRSIKNNNKVLFCYDKRKKINERGNNIQILG